MSRKSNKLYVFLIYAALALVTFVAYEKIRNHDFIDYDDNEYVFENQHVKAGLTRDSIRWAFTTYHANNWHPLRYYHFSSSWTSDWPVLLYRAKFWSKGLVKGFLIYG